MTHYHKLCSLMLCFAAFYQSATAQTPTTDNALETNKSNIVVANERTINTAQLEFSPAFYEDGIVFISSQKPVSKEKIFDNRIESTTMSIFLARRDEQGQLGKSVAFSNALVSSLHEGPLTFDKTGENIFFSRNNNEGNGKKATYTEGVSRLKIYTALKKGEDNWGVPIELPFCENNSDACHPSISVDGDKLYFSSNRFGGYGGMDLYVSERVNGIWGKPTNLGPKVNTPKNEVFPYIHADGTLFYSSNGLPGSGGLDIYYLKNNAQDGDLGGPVNLGAPFNSDKDDFGFIIDVDMKNGYFTSGRTGGLGGDDIYSFSMSQATLFENLANEYVAEYVGNTGANTTGSTTNPSNPPAPKVSNNGAMQNLNLLVIDRQTGKPIQDATVGYLNLNELSMSEIIADNNGKQAQIIKADGTFALELVESKMKNRQTNGAGKVPVLAAKTGSYLISAAKKGYTTEQLILKKGDSRSDIVILLSRPSDFAMETGSVKNNKSGDFTLNEGNSYQLSNIYYNFNDATIRPEARKDLEVLYIVMTKYPDMKIELASHTDCRGTAEYNTDLSQRRAASAVQYLINKGIDAQRIVAKGYGETMLRNKCADGVSCSEEQHKVNRRTEVKITKSGSAEGQIMTDFFTPTR